MPFRTVCEAINSVIKEDDWPLLVSLECHADSAGQDETVKIMGEIWGDRLVTKALKPGSHIVSPGELKGKIVLMVSQEYIHNYPNSLSYCVRWNGILLQTRPATHKRATTLLPLLPPPLLPPTRTSQIPPEVSISARCAKVVKPNLSRLKPRLHRACRS